MTQGTGKALRRLVVSGRVRREGKGGVGDPFRYRYSTDTPAEVAPEEVAAAGQASAVMAAAAAAATAKAAAARDAGARGKKSTSKVSDDKDRAGQGRKRVWPGKAGNDEVAAANSKRASGRPGLAVNAGIEAGEMDFSSEAAPFAALLHHDHDDSHERASHPPSNPMRVAVEEDRETDGRPPHAVVAVAPFTPKWARKYRAAGGNKSPQAGGNESPTSPGGTVAGKGGAAAGSAGSKAGQAGDGKAAGSGATCLARRGAPAGVCVDDSLDADAADNARFPSLQSEAKP